MKKEFEETYAKHLEWNRDTNGRLYYVLWALFLGGFVYTFKLHRAVGCYQALGLMAFRALAIVGSVVNFLYQENAIDSLGQLRQQLMRTDKYLWLRSEAKQSKEAIPQEEYDSALRMADDEESKAKRHGFRVELQDHIGECLHIFLLIITALYLSLALWLSFVFYPV
ncbi:MAG: hypothetical protein ABSD44_15935 [Terracidiphilus sp.]